MSLQSGSCLNTSSDGATAAAGLPSPNVVRMKNRESEAWYTYDDVDDAGADSGTSPSSTQAGAPASTTEPSSGSDIFYCRARQLYKHISMLFLFPVKDGKLSTGVNATFNASCYG